MPYPFGHRVNGIAGGYGFLKHEKENDPGRIRTCNHWCLTPCRCKVPMPYQFGHRVNGRWMLRKTRRMWHARAIAQLHPRQNEGREIRTPNLLTWSQMRCRCAIPPLLYVAEHFAITLKWNSAAFAEAFQLSLVNTNSKQMKKS